MKFIRSIGSVLSALLTAILIVALAVSLFLFSAASMITDKTIDDVVGTTMENESVQDSIADMLYNQLSANTGNTSLGDMLTNINEEKMKNTLSNLLELPSLQLAVSDVISESITDIMSGNIDGEIDFGEKITDVLTGNPEVYEKITNDVTHYFVEDEELREVFITSSLSSTLFGNLEPDIIHEILDAPEVQDTVADITSYMVSHALSNGNVEEMDVADRISTLISENPTVFEDAIAAYIPDETTKQAILSDANTYAEQAGKNKPSASMTDTELAIYLLDLYGDEYNQKFYENLKSSSVLPWETRDSDIDYTDFDSSAVDFSYAADDTTTIDTISIQLDEETVKILNTLSQALTFLRSAVFFLCILCGFAVCYLIMALFTWSFDHPLIFCGIGSVVAGAILIIISFFSPSNLLPFAGGETTEIATALLTSVWNVLAEKLMISGIVTLILGIIMIAGFVTAKHFQKKPAAASAKKTPETVITAA